MLTPSDDHHGPPVAHASETALIGAVLLAPEYFPVVSNLVRPEDIYQDRERRVYEALLWCSEEGKPLDIAVLVDRLSRVGALEAVGGLAALAELTDHAIAAHARSYALEVRSASRTRDLMNCVETASTDLIAGDLPQDVIARLKRTVDVTDDAIPDDTIAEVLNRRMNWLEEDVSVGAGLKTGWGQLDHMLGGLRGGQLIIVGGRPGMGKSVVLQNLCCEVAIRQNQPSLACSLEMSADEWVDRTICSLASVDATRYRDRKLEPGDISKIGEISESVARAPLSLSDASKQSVASIHQKAAQVALRANLGLVAVDYLQLVAAEDRKRPRQEQIGQIAQGLKNMAKELDVPVVAAAQLNRGLGDRRDKRPRLSDLREGGDIEQAADVVVFVHRPAMFSEKAHPDEAEFIVAKQRNGGLGTVKVDWIAKHQRFQSCGSEVQEDFWDE